MKHIPFMLLILLSTSAAQSQNIPQLTSDQHRQLQASIDAYMAQPNYPSTQPQMQAVQSSPASAIEPRPWEYGQSVMTDIRQMNF